MAVLSLTTSGLPSGVSVVVALLLKGGPILSALPIRFGGIGSIHFLAGCWTETTLTSLLCGPLYSSTQHGGLLFQSKGASKGASHGMMDIIILSDVIINM